MKVNTILKAVCLSLVFVSFGCYASGKGSNNPPPKPRPCNPPSKQTSHNNAMTGANKELYKKTNVSGPAKSSSHKSKL